MSEKTLYGNTTLARKILRAVVKAGLMNVAPDKIPPVDKIYDFTLVRSINAELDAARWKPTA